MENNTSIKYSAAELTEEFLAIMNDINNNRHLLDDQDFLRALLDRCIELQTKMKTNEGIGTIGAVNDINILVLRQRVKPKT